MKERIVPQKDLTAECWSIQFWGKDACKKCEFRDTKKCGGKDIRKTGKNKKGKRSPLGKPVR
jgi:hypothetical protein